MCVHQVNHMSKGDVTGGRKMDRVTIRCRTATRDEFKRVCGYFPDSEAALRYLMSRFDPEVYKRGRGELL